MSEPALVGVMTTDGMFTARYLNWSGRPAKVVADLRTIWSATFGRDTAATGAALLGHDWSALCPSCTHRRPPAATIRVTGVGHAMAHHLPVARGQAATAERGGYLEWMFLLDEAAQQVVVYEATVHDRWLPHSRHPLDSGGCPAVLGCGGRAADGHRWVPARVGLPVPGHAVDGHPGIAYEAEVCPGAHPHGFVIARFTDAVAEQIAADTTGHTPPWTTSVPTLRRDSGEFDLVWPDRGQGPASMRVGRDRDNRLLIGAYLLPWQRHDQHAATTRPYRRGERVVLEHSTDAHTRLRPGDEGTVLRYQQQRNTVHIAWDSGSSLAVLLGEGDRIRHAPAPASSSRGGGSGCSSP